MTLVFAYGVQLTVCVLFTRMRFIQCVGLSHAEARTVLSWVVDVLLYFPPSYDLHAGSSTTTAIRPRTYRYAIQTDIPVQPRCTTHQPASKLISNHTIAKTTTASSEHL